MLFNKSEVNHGLSPLGVGIHQVSLVSVRVDRTFGSTLLFRFMSESGCGYEHRINCGDKYKDSQHKYIFDLIYLILEGTGIDAAPLINTFSSFVEFEASLEGFASSIILPKNSMYIKLVKQESNGKTFIGFNPIKPPFVSKTNNLSYNSTVDDKVNVYTAMAGVASEFPSF